MAEHVFETTSSETLHTGKIFALRRDRVRMPGGKDVTREVVEHFGAVAVVAMDDDGNIPMVYQYRHALGRRLWELPAGLLDVHGEAAHLTFEVFRELLIVKKQYIWLVAALPGVRQMLRYSGQGKALRIRYVFPLERRFPVYPLTQHVMCGGNSAAIARFF